MTIKGRAVKNCPKWLDVIFGQLHLFTLILVWTSQVATLVRIVIFDLTLLQLYYFNCFEIWSRHSIDIFFSGRTRSELLSMQFQRFKLESKFHWLLPETWSNWSHQSWGLACIQVSVLNINVIYSLRCLIGLLLDNIKVISIIKWFN